MTQETKQQPRQGLGKSQKSQPSQKSQISEITVADLQPETRRWFILLGVSLFSFSNAMPSATVSLVMAETEEYHNIGSEAALQFINVFAYSYLLFGYVFSNFLVEYFAPCMMITTTFNTAGGIMRWLAGSNYKWSLIGQCLAAFAKCGYLQAPAVVAERWFGTNERFWVIIIATYSAYLGWAFGKVIPCYYMAAYPIEEAFPKLYFLQMIIMALPTIVFAFSIRNHPKIPPTAGALVKTEEKSKNLWETTRLLIADRNYVLNTLCIGFFLGLSYTVSSVTSYIYGAKNYSNIQFAYIGLAYLCIGMLGALVGTLYLKVKKSTNFDALLRVLFTLGIIGLIGLAIAGPEAPFWLVILLTVLVGFGYITFTPFGIESLIQVSFPLNESIAVGHAFMLAQIFHIIMNQFAISSIIGNQGFWFLTVCALPATIYVLFWYKTEFKRTKLEHEKQEELIEREQLLLQSQEIINPIDD